MNKICAIVVTYNRVELLKLTIEKLLKQTRKIDEVIIINNASTDNTGEFLAHLLSHTRSSWAFYSFFFSFFFLGPHLRHMEVPRLGV